MMDEHYIEEVNFTYLESIQSVDIIKKLKNCIGKANEVFKRHLNVWSSNKIRLSKAQIISELYSLLLSFQLPYMHAELGYPPQKLSLLFHCRCLCKILMLPCKDKTRNKEVLICVNSRPLSVMMGDRQIQFSPATSCNYLTIGRLKFL